MKKVFLSITYLFLFSACVFADDSTVDNPNWGIQPASKDVQSLSPSQKVWDAERDQIIDKNYGSDQSPAFLNRENVDPQGSYLDDNYNYDDNDDYYVY